MTDVCCAIKNNTLLKLLTSNQNWRTMSLLELVNIKIPAILSHLQSNRATTKLPKTFRNGAGFLAQGDTNATSKRLLRVIKWKNKLFSKKSYNHICRKVQPTNKVKRPLNKHVLWRKTSLSNVKQAQIKAPHEHSFS